MKTKVVYQLPRLEMALQKVVSIVTEKGEVNANDVSTALHAWRDSSKRLWLIDKMRDYSIDFRVEGFASTGRPIMTLFVRKDIA